MPGLIDAHCHMTYGESRSEEEIDLYTSPELRTLKAAWNAQKVLRCWGNRNLPAGRQLLHRRRPARGHHGRDRAKARG